MNLYMCIYIYMCVCVYIYKAEIGWTHLKSVGGWTLVLGSLKRLLVVRASEVTCGVGGGVL